MSSQHEWTGDDNERAIPAVPGPRRPQNQTEPYEPLHEPGRTFLPPSSFAVELAVTRRILDETGPLNIHDHGEMLKAAVSLNCRVRALLALLDAERGGS